MATRSNKKTTAHRAPIWRTTAVIAATLIPPVASASDIMGPRPSPVSDRMSVATDTVAQPVLSPPAERTTPAIGTAPSLADAELIPTKSPTDPVTLAQAPQSQLPLGTPRGTSTNRLQAEEKAPSAALSEVAATVLPLAAVIAVILALAWIARRLARTRGDIASAIGAGGRAPSGVLEILGRFPVQRSLTLVLMRLDKRVLLVQQSAGKGGPRMETLCEITDPDEVASILLKTRDDAGESADRQFRNALSELETKGYGNQPDRFDTAARRALISDDGDRAELLADAYIEPTPALANRPYQERQADPTPAEAPANDPAARLRAAFEAHNAQTGQDLRESNGSGLPDPVSALRDRLDALRSREVIA